jgi:hypothetical protein
MEAPTGGSGRRRHRGPVGELNLHGTCAPPTSHPAQYVRAVFQGSSYGPQLVRRQMASQWAERQSGLAFAFALADFTFSWDTRDRASNALTVLSPRAPGERSNGLNAAYVISKQSLYRPDLLLTFGNATLFFPLCVTVIWLAQCIRIWRRTSTRRTLRGPSILNRTRMKFTGPSDP